MIKAGEPGKACHGEPQRVCARVVGGATGKECKALQMSGKRLR